jgi:hypothetical protein
LKCCIEVGVTSPLLRTAMFEDIRLHHLLVQSQPPQLQQQEHSRARSSLW